MANIVPQSDLLGQLGRLEKRWFQVHAAMARVQAVQLIEPEGEIFPEGAPPTSLYVNADGRLTFGADTIARLSDITDIGEDLSAIVEQVNTFFAGADPEHVDTLLDIQEVLTGLGSRLDTAEAGIEALLSRVLQAEAVNERVTAFFAGEASSPPGSPDSLVELQVALAAASTGNENIVSALQGEIQRATQAEEAITARLDEPDGYTLVTESIDFLSVSEGTYTSPTSYEDINALAQTYVQQGVRDSLSTVVTSAEATFGEGLDLSGKAAFYDGKIFLTSVVDTSDTDLLFVRSAGFIVTGGSFGGGTQTDGPHTLEIIVQLNGVNTDLPGLSVGDQIQFNSGNLYPIVSITRFALSTTGRYSLSVMGDGETFLDDCNDRESEVLVISSVATSPLVPPVARDAFVSKVSDSFGNTAESTFLFLKDTVQADDPPIITRNKRADILDMNTFMLFMGNDLSTSADRVGSVAVAIASALSAPVSGKGFKFRGLNPLYTWVDPTPLPFVSYAAYQCVEVSGAREGLSADVTSYYPVRSGYLSNAGVLSGVTASIDGSLLYPRVELVADAVNKYAAGATTATEVLAIFGPVDNSPISFALDAVYFRDTADGKSTPLTNGWVEVILEGESTAVFVRIQADAEGYRDVVQHVGTRVSGLPLGYELVGAERFVDEIQGVSDYEVVIGIDDTRLLSLARANSASVRAEAALPTLRDLAKARSEARISELRISGTDGVLGLISDAAAQVVNTLNGLADVVVNNVSIGQVLSYNGQVWSNANPANVADIADLDDVVLSNPQADEALVYDGTHWINRAVSVSILSDVDGAQDATEGQVLAFSDATSSWVPTTIQQGATSLVQLSDVSADIVNAESGQVLTFSIAQGKWTAADSPAGVQSLSDLDDVRTTGPNAPGAGAFLRWSTENGGAWEPDSGDELYPVGIKRGTIQANGEDNLSFEPTALVSTFMYTQQGDEIIVTKANISPVFPVGSNEFGGGSVFMTATDLGAVDNPFGTVFVTDLHASANSIYIGSLQLSVAEGELLLTPSGGSARTVANTSDVSEAVAAEASARASAISDAITAERAVTDSSISNAIITERTLARQYVDTNVADAYAAANTYTDTQITEEETARDNAITAAVLAESIARNSAITAAIAALDIPTDTVTAAELAQAVQALEGEDASIWTSVTNLTTSVEGISTELESVSDQVSALVIPDAQGDVGQVQIAGELLSDGETRAFSSFPITGAIEFTLGVLSRLAFEPSSATLSGQIDLGSSTQRYKSLYASGGFVDTLTINGGTLSRSGSRIAFKGNEIYSAVETDFQITSAVSSVQSIVTGVQSTVSGLQATVSEHTNDISSLETSVANILNNTDPAALDSLTEVVAAFQAADSSLNGAITSLSTSLSARITGIAGISGADYSAHEGDAVLANAGSLHDADLLLSLALSDKQDALLFGAGLTLAGGTLNTSFDIDEYATIDYVNEAVLNVDMTGVLTSASTLSSAKLDENAITLAGIEVSLGGSIGASTLRGAIGAAEEFTVEGPLELVDAVISFVNPGYITAASVSLLLSAKLDADDFSAYTLSVASTIARIDEELGQKQDALTAGLGIALSGSGTISTAFDIADYATAATLSNYVTASDLETELALKLTASTYTAFVNALPATLARKLDAETFAAFTLSYAADLSQTSSSIAALASDISNLSSSLANYALAADLANYATVGSLADYATAATLSNYATTESLSDYATTASLANYATVASLADYATTASLSAYATAATLSNYATVESLSDYATAATLSNYATVESLSDYATSATLSNYALSADVSSSLALKLDTATHTAYVGAVSTSLAALETSISGKQDQLLFGAGLTLTGSTLSAHEVDLSGYATTAALSSAQSDLEDLIDAKQDSFSVGAGLSLTGATLSTSFSIGDYATSAQLSSSVGAINAALDLKLSISAFNTYTAGTLATQLSAKASVASLAAYTLTNNTRVGAVEADVTELETALGVLSSDVVDWASTVTDLASDITAEAAARASADTALQGAIDAKVSFTDALARSAISAGGDLSYNSGTGVMSYTSAWTQSNGVVSTTTPVIITGYMLELFEFGDAPLSQAPIMTLDGGNLSAPIDRIVDLGTLDQGRLF